MNIREKVVLLIAIFSAIYILFILVVSLSLFPNCCLEQLANLCQNECYNFLIVIISFLTGAFILVAFISFCYAKLIKLRRKKIVPKLGKVMVERGYVTEEEVKEALSEQRQRLGEILLKAGLITTEQLEHALDFQKTRKKKIGEILRELGYSTDENILWALRKMNRRLGEIFVEKGFFTEIEIVRIFARLMYERAM